MTSAAGARVHVVVAEGRCAPPAAKALERVGAGICVEVVAGAEACVRRARSAPADLVVVGRERGDEAERLLDELADDGPPVIVLACEEDDGEALALFERGAADCIRVGPDLDEVLPVVALEQIRRHREERERGRRERRLRWFESLHEAIVGQIPAALAVLGPDRRVVTVNPEFSRLFGVSAAEARGRPFERIVPPELVHSADTRRLLDELEAGGGAEPRLARVEGALPRGRTLWLDVRGQRLDGEGRVLLVLVDVSEREHLARRVRDLRGFAEGVVQNLNGALVVTDRTGAVTYANAPAAELFGLEAHALRGIALSDRLDDGPPGRSWLARTLRDGERLRGSESRVVRDDGRRAPVAVSCAPLVDADGGRTGAVAVLQDLTELEQLQRQVLQSEKLASIGQLAAGVAHEINNPVGFVHANLFQIAEYVTDLRRVWQRVEALREAVAADDLDAARRAAREVGEVAEEVDADFVLGDLAKAVRESQEGTERVRHIVQDLRGFSRQDSDERVPADLNQCLDSTAHIVWTMMKHSVALEKEYADLPPVLCNPMQLKQVFMNLLMNATQAVAARHGQDDVSGRVRLRTAREGDRVVIGVSDDGCGIAPENLGRLFDPFFTTKPVGEGNGLGLSTSYGIVERHGGTIRVESTPGLGTTFEVVLPVGERAQTP